MMAEQDLASHIALALDVPDLEAARRLVEQTRDHIGVFKVGLELFTGVGPPAVEVVLDAGAKCFLDLKMHDIPATMGRSAARAAAMGVDYLTVHGSAGKDALVAASESAGSMQLLAVTILTSLDEPSLRGIGFSDGVEPSVTRLAKLAWDAGLRGFVTSAHECAALRASLGDEAFLVTPGIRPTGAAADDQRRVMSPAAAIASGSNMLVVGRPIRDATDVIAAASALAQEVELALRR
jgi:orotidine-5'-phosphate decarboxylase